VITLEHIYFLMGLMLAGVAIVNARDHSNPRWINNTAFWGLYSASFLLGSHISDLSNGLIVLAMVACASIRGLGQSKHESVTQAERDAGSARWGNKLFWIALLIPTVTVAGSYFFKKAPFAAHIDQKQVTLIALAIATIVSLAAGLAVLKPPLSAPIHEARRLLDSIGWAAVLPQMLAALGALFAIAGVGTVVSTLAERWIPLGQPFEAVMTYTIGMAIFTMVMGNAFAAFPVMTAGIGLPLIVGKFGGDPVIMAAVGMLSGFCGTLMTPMAANFNIVPTALLDLDEYAVIRVQIPTAILLLIVNTIIMNLFVFHH
jgi:Predicted membrane protein